MSTPTIDRARGLPRRRATDIGALLQHHHAQCEVNYLHLQRLLPQLCAGAELRIGIARDSAAGMQHLLLRVLERSRYTALVQLLQQDPVWGARGIELHVRAYLDVAMAEVVASPPAAPRLRPHYDLPNAHGLASDEKWQLNRLLGEWLGHCLSDGHSVDAGAFTEHD